MTLIQSQKYTGPGSAAPAGAAFDGGRTIRMDELPESIRRILAKAAPQDWGLIATVFCRSPFMLDLVQGFRFLDAVWHVAAPKEHRVGLDRITGAEMDEFRRRVEGAVKAVLDVGLDLATRARLTKIQEGYLGILNRYGYKRPKAEARAGSQDKTMPATVAAPQSVGDRAA